MGRDMLNKFRAEIAFDENKMRIHIPHNNAWEAQMYIVQEFLKILESKNKESSNRNKGCPFIWATEKPGKANLLNW